MRPGLRKPKRRDEMFEFLKVQQRDQTRRWEQELEERRLEREEKGGESARCGSTGTDDERPLHVYGEVCAEVKRCRLL